MGPNRTGPLTAHRAGKGGRRAWIDTAGAGPAVGDIATVRAAGRGQPVTAGRVVRPSHPRRQAVLPAGHGTTGRDHCDSGPGQSRPAPGSLGGTRNVTPSSHRWERLNRTALGHLGPGSPCLPTWAGHAARDASDHGRLTSRRSGVSCCGARHGDNRRAGGQGPGRARRPVDNGEPRSLPTGRTPVRRDGRALFRGCLLRSYGRGKGSLHQACRPSPGGCRRRRAGYPVTSMAKCRAAGPGMREGRST
jgi:hypothetical protein